MKIGLSDVLLCVFVLRPLLSPKEGVGRLNCLLEVAVALMQLNPIHKKGP